MKKTQAITLLLIIKLNFKKAHNKTLTALERNLTKTLPTS